MDTSTEAEAAVVLAPGASSFTLRPVISDLIRTGFAVPGSYFLVEGIDIASRTPTSRWQIIRLLLGDGDVCIQALLGGTMHRFVHVTDIRVGSYVRVDNFQLQALPGLAGSRKPMVYLVVSDLRTVRKDA